MIGRLLRRLHTLPVPSGQFVVATTTLAEATLWYPPAAAGRLPLVVYLPGWGGRACDNASLAVELASHGFVVAALDDSWPEGCAIAPMRWDNEDARDATLRLIDAKLSAGVTAVRRLLDGLGGMDTEDPPLRLRGRPDLARAGILGFSFGGAVAAEASRHDPRLAAVINMDGWLFGAAARDGVTCAYLLLSDDTPAPTAAQLASRHPATRIRAALDDADLRQQAVQFATLGGWKVTLRGADHASFTDARLHAPWRRLRGIDPITAQRILGACCLSFFRYVLLDQMREGGAPLPDMRQLPAARVDAAVPPRRIDNASAAEFIPPSAQPPVQRDQSRM